MCADDMVVVVIRCGWYSWYFNLRLSQGGIPAPPHHSPLFHVKTTSVFQEMYSLPGCLQGKLPYQSYLLWSEKPLQLQLWSKAQQPSECGNICEQGLSHKLWVGFATWAATVMGVPLVPWSSLRPLTFQRKLQNSYLPLGGRNGIMT